MEWISINTEAPEDEYVYLAWSLTADELVLAGYDSESDNPWTLEDGHGTPIEVEHWMPLPKRPE